MRESRTRYGADERELEAITREIHAQLRALYDQPSGASPPPAPRPSTHALHPRAAADVARFVAVFLLPPLTMVALGLVLKLVKDGF